MFLTLSERVLADLGLFASLPPECKMTPLTRHSATIVVHVNLVVCRCVGVLQYFAYLP